MTHEEYAVYVAKQHGRGTAKENLVWAAIGVAEEAGEIAGLAKKMVFHEREFTTEKIKDECGDLLFYFTWFLEQTGLTLEEVMEANKAKLDKRYPHGWVPGGGIRE